MDIKTPADLLRCELLHDDVLVDHPGHVGWAEWFKKIGLMHPDASRGTRFSHAHLALDAAVAGHGVTLGRKALTAADRRIGLLVSPTGPSIPSSFTYWLLTPRSFRQAQQIERFHGWLQSPLTTDAG